MSKGSERIGFIGLGNMGYNISKRLIEKLNLVVYDIVEEKRRKFEGIAEVASSPLDVANKCSVILTSLPGPKEVEEVAREIVNGKEMETLIDLSTTGIKASKKIYEIVSKKGKEMLDSPVSGGVYGAKEGKLTLMVAGKRGLFDKYLNILKLIGNKVFYVGDKVGQGQALKLVNNLLSLTALASTSEAILLGLKEGLDMKVMINVINESSGRNSATQDKFPKSIIPGTYDYGFKLKLALKDLKLYLEACEEDKTPTFIASAIYQIWKYANDMGGEEEDFTAIFKYIKGLSRE